MGSVRITELPARSQIDGSEWIPVATSSTTYRVGSDTYRKSIDAVFAVNVAERYGTTHTDLQSAITDAQGKALWLDPSVTFTGDGSQVDFAGVGSVHAWGATLQDIRPLIRDTTWLGGTVEQVNDTAAADLVQFGSNAQAWSITSKPAADLAHVCFKIESDANGNQVSNIGVYGCRGLRPGDSKGSFEIRDCADVVIADYMGSGGADDGVVVKAIDAVTTGVLINGVVMRDHASLFGTGDDCGPGIEGVKATNLLGIDVAAIKVRAGESARPGGHVRDVTVENATLIDRNGTKLDGVNVVALQDGNARIDNLLLNNVWVIGRFASSTQSDREPVAVRTQSGSAGIGYVEINGGGYIDPLNGNPNDASNPGYPAFNAIVRGTGGQDIDEVRFRNWYGSHFRQRGVLGQGDATPTKVKLLAFEDSRIEAADLDGNNVPWVQLIDDGELEYANVRYGPTADAGDEPSPRDAAVVRASWSIQSPVGTHLTENAGTATFSGDGTTVTFAIAHGLSGTPVGRAVWGESADAAGDKYVSSVDGTNINVTFASAPASGTDNVVLGFDARV